MGNHLCKALMSLQDEKGRIVPEGQTFTCSTGMFTDKNGKVVVPHYVQVLGGDDLPAEADIQTTEDGRRVPMAPEVPLSAIQDTIPVDPGQNYTLDKGPASSAPENSVQADIPAAPATPPPGEPTLGTPGSPAAPADASASGQEAPAASGGFDRAAAFQRLKALGKPAPGNTSNENLAKLLEDAEAAVMIGGAGQ